MPDNVELRNLGKPTLRLHGSSTFEISFMTDDGKLQVWQVSSTNANIQDGVQRAGWKVVAANDRPEIIRQRDNQREAIGRLLEHVSFHHDELKQLTAEQCTWLRNEWAKSSNTKRLNELPKEAPMTGTLPGYETNMLITATLRDVRDEIGRAIDKHGIERTPLNPDLEKRDAFLCIAEEFGELAHELTYDAGSADRTGQEASPEEVQERAEKEAIQVAAMAIAFVVGSRRRSLLP